MAASNAIKTQGTTLQYLSAAPATYTNICTVQSISGPSGSASELDATTLCDLAEETVTGFVNWGTVTLNGLFDPSAPGLVDMLSRFKSSEINTYRIVMTDGTTIQFDAFVSAYAPDFSAKDLAKISITLRVSGDVDIT